MSSGKNIFTDKERMKTRNATITFNSRFPDGDADKTSKWKC